MTTNNSLKYTLNDVNNIIFQGFDYTIPNETLEIISLLSMQVGSPDYVKTPIFKKREIPELSKDFNETNIKKRKGNKATEIVNDVDGDWNSEKSFQTTKIKSKTGLDGDIDLIRVYINKITEKNYIDMCHKIIDIVEKSFDKLDFSLKKVSQSTSDPSIIGQIDVDEYGLQ